MISASAIPRLLVCPGSAHLRQADEQNAYADEGTDRHADAEAAVDLGQHDELPRQVRELIEPGDVLAAECAFAYDVSDDTARELGHIGKRAYDRRPFEIPGTVDLLIRSGRRAIVVDYKLYLEVDPAASNAQVATYALMVARVYGYLEVTVAIVYLGADWRPADIAVLSAFDLDVHAERLKALFASSDRSLKVSAHCKHCHAFHDCPEQKKLAAEAGGGALAVRVEAMVPFENDDDAAAAYELLSRIGTLYGRLKGALAARAKERPFKLRSGKMYGLHERQGDREYDGRVVHEVATKILGREIADKIVEMTSTQVKFKEVVQAVIPRGKFAAKQREVFEEVEKRGGLTRKKTTVVEEYDAGPRIVADEQKMITEVGGTSPF